MSKKDVVILDVVLADEIHNIVRQSYPKHICGCFGDKCDECEHLDKLSDALTHKTRLIATKGDLDLTEPNMYIQNTKPMTD